jgi:hypothetical protein
MISFGSVLLAAGILFIFISIGDYMNNKKEGLISFSITSIFIIVGLLLLLLL